MDGHNSSFDLLFLQVFFEAFEILTKHTNNTVTLIFFSKALVFRSFRFLLFSFNGKLDYEVKWTMVSWTAMSNEQWKAGLRSQMNNAKLDCEVKWTMESWITMSNEQKFFFFL